MEIRDEEETTQKAIEEEENRYGITHFLKIKVLIFLLLILNLFVARDT